MLGYGLAPCARSKLDKFVDIITTLTAILLAAIIIMIIALFIAIVVGLTIQGIFIITDGNLIEYASLSSGDASLFTISSLILSGLVTTILMVIAIVACVFVFGLFKSTFNIVHKIVVSIRTNNVCIPFERC